MQPLYNTADRPAILAITADPRVSFSGVSTRVFPLKASMNTLQEFCDNYFNFPDDPEEMKKTQTNFFRPAAPYVYFQMINYGAMAIESENLGWFAQNEILFLVPLEWYKVDDAGRLYFFDWAMVCPFIFVDNDMSLTTGRETYGWSKVRCWLDRVPTSWTVDPRLPRRVLDMRTKVFTHLFAGESPKPRSLVEITQEQPPTVGPGLFTQKTAFNPLWNAPETLRSGISLSGNLFEALSNLPILGYERRDLSTLTRMSARAVRNMRAMLPWLALRPPVAPERGTPRRAANGSSSPNLYFNQLTLKQFRDAAEPDLACYQAIVNSRISVERYYDVGVLGGPNVALGDLSGGFTLKVHEYPEQAIIQTLGLEVADRTMDEDHVPIAYLKPTLPFWMACDLNYDTGETVAWRGKASRQWNSTADPLPRGGNRFNTTRGAAIQEVAGPFYHPNTTVRVFPLLADPQKLQNYCNDYLNNLDGPGAGVAGNSFKPWGCYVYMIVTTYGNEDPDQKSWAANANLGQIAERDVAFCLPVKWKKLTPSGKQLNSLAILTPYVFGSSSRHVITEREINGRPMTFSEIFNDDDSWLRSSGPLRARSLAKLKTLLIPSLDIGQPAELRDLIEVTERQPEKYTDDVPWAVIKANWLPELENDRKNKMKSAADAEKCWDDAVDLFRQFFARRRSLNFLSLKQYRGTASAKHACYQALVLLRKKMRAISWIAKLKSSRNHELHVLIHRYPTMPIVETLGLKVKATDSRGSSVIDFLEPIRPFFMRISLKEQLGQKICSRVNSTDWKTESPAEDSETALDEQTLNLIEQIEEPHTIIEHLLDKERFFSGADRPEPRYDPVPLDPNFGKDPNARVYEANRYPRDDEEPAGI